MKYALIVCLALYVFLQVLIFILDKWNKKANAKHEAEINERCDRILESVARTEATIAEERKTCGSLPEEYRDEFLAKYDEIGKKINGIKADVDRIRNSIGSKVAV